MSDTGFPQLSGGQTLRVNRVPLVREPLPADQAAGESATTGTVPLGSLAGTEFGIWEMGTGSMYDVEAEEVFFVTAGHGTVVIEPFEGHPARTAGLVPGTVMRLSAGMKTTWTVTEPLRKIYFTPTEPSGSSS
ncbi:cupin domain-containing protein [Paeniglutamicibacter sp. MACA_103]|uniref:cupin domain-containing protein n=1 Tax=Paeniglutamicibacter sp. MACA_103 TaxID=3377337 RepID=UPI003895AFCB